MFWDLILLEDRLYVCVCVHIYMYIHVYIYMHTYLACLYLCVCVYLCTYSHTCDPRFTEELEIDYCSRDQHRRR